MNSDERFWNSNLEELKKGYYFDHHDNCYTCLICGKRFEDGYVYEEEGRFFEARKAIEIHISKEHGSVFETLLDMDKKYTGITEHQKEILLMFYNGCSDKQIVESTGIGSTSTIRNQRFTFKEKQKQAKIFLIIMELLEENKKDVKNTQGEELVSIHKNAKMVDERYAITEKERDSVIKTYFDANDQFKLKKFPTKEKKKIIVLTQLMKQFDETYEYTEMQVNDILRKNYEDYVTIRRYLIEYGFMDRKKDCSKYWVRK